MGFSTVFDGVSSRFRVVLRCFCVFLVMFRPFRLESGARVTAAIPNGAMVEDQETLVSGLVGSERP